MATPSEEPTVARPRPCASCPYRKDVPSGLWHPEEYAKLPQYDGETFEQQAVSVFMCHQQTGHACSGWLGHRDPYDLMAVRLGLMRGTLDPSVAEYQTEVPLFESGAEAAEHGMAGVEAPDIDAQIAIDKLVRAREARGLG